MVVDRQTDGVRGGEEGGEGRFTFAVNIIQSDQSERDVVRSAAVRYVRRHSSTADVSGLVVTHRCMEERHAVFEGRKIRGRLSVKCSVFL